MKKIILSLGVILVFLAYAWHQKNEADNVQVIAPTIPTPTSTSTTLSIPSSASGTPPTAIPTAQPLGQYKDGTYTGSVADAFYGNIQVQAVISGGRITDVVFLQYPNDRGTSIEINSQAMPFLKQEAIAAQNANVDIISGAT